MTEIRYIEDSLTGENYKHGISFKFDLAIPDVEADEFALIVEHDGRHNENVNAMIRLADEGKAPYCIHLEVYPGELTMPDGSKRNMRMNSYDLFDREYGDFVVYELIPYVTEKYELKISASPDMHMTSGGSSGGISAFVMAWFHSEYFRRVYMSTPSFLAIGRGFEVPYLVRKHETKPLRIYHECSENEPNDYFGASKPINDEIRAALIYCGYDYKYEYFPGEGHCSRYRNAENAYARFEWLWSGWRTDSIKPPRCSRRVANVIGENGGWELADSFPSSAKQTCCAASDAFSSIVRSNDGLAWYCADTNDDIVRMYTDASLIGSAKSIVHATLYTVAGIYPKGAIDVAVAKTDRLFVLTAIGVQCVRSYGIVDAILALPDSSKPLEIAVSDALYVKTECGIYRRVLKDECVTEDEIKRRQVSYYDD